ncbi:hypothetical protein ACUXIR_000837 [Staphylococcus hominis]
MDKPMTKPVKIAVGIYLALVLLACSSYLVFILIGSLQGNDMSNSVLDTDHRYINNVSKDSNQDLNKVDHSASHMSGEVENERITSSHQSMTSNNKKTDSNVKE